MSYSRRQLEALGEPLGDSVTRKEGGRVIYGGGGSSSGTQTTTTDVPEWARDTAKRNLASAEALTTDKPYQSYTNWAKQEGLDPNRVAGFTGLQNTAFQGAGNLQTAPQLGMASGLAGTAAQRAMNTGYDAGQFQNQYQGFDPYQSGEFQNQFQAPDQFQAGQFGADRVQAQNLQNFQMGPAERVSTQSFAQPGSADAFMSPYMQSVVGIQQREAQRQADIAGTQRGAQAAKMGAFGGSRQAIMEAEAARNLAQQKGDIQATGLQSAFQQAQGQFNTEQQARLAAQQANQGAGLTVGQQNLAALLGTQQFGAGQNLQAQLANQQQNLETQRLAEQSRQFGAGQGLTAAQLQAQYGMSAQQAEEASRQFASNQEAQQAAQRAQFGQSAQQLGEQSRQYGAGLGLQGLQAAMSGAGQMANIGTQQFGQQKDILGLQNQFGSQQQANEQAKLGYNMQDYSAAQQYPYQQLSFLSNIMRGTPMGGVTTMYGAQPTMAQNIGALGMGAYGLNQMMGRAEGGTVSSYAAGGSVDSPQSVESIVDRLSDPQLQQAAEAAQARGDVEQLQIIQQEMAMRASERGGMAGAFNQLPQAQQQQMMAGGGVVAFAGNEDENEDGLGQLVGGMMPSEGNPEVYKQLTGVFPQLLANVAKAKYTPMSDDKYNQAIAKRRTMLEEGASPSPYADIKEKIASMRGEDEKSLRQGRGLAALQAAAALTQGRGLAQGLGRAGGAFAESYGKALQADSAQKRALMNMEMNAADAMRKERMGLNRDAITAADQARKDHDAAQRFGITKANALANVAGKFATATKPTKAAGSGAGKGPKINEQLAAAEIAHEINPTSATLATVNALRRAVAQTKTSDFGPTRAGLGEAGLEVRLGEAITEAQQKIKFTPDYLKADAAGKQKMLRDAAAQVRTNAGVNTNSTSGSGSGTVEGLPAGATVKGDKVYDSSGKLIGHVK
jgi:hypothetical protein